MYSRLRQYHLIGAIGGFLTVLSAIIGIAIFSSYYISPESLITSPTERSLSTGTIPSQRTAATSCCYSTLVCLGNSGSRNPLGVVEKLGGL